VDQIEIEKIKEEELQVNRKKKEKKIWKKILHQNE